MSEFNIYLQKYQENEGLFKTDPAKINMLFQGLTEATRKLPLAETIPAAKEICENIFSGLTISVKENNPAIYDKYFKPIVYMQKEERASVCVMAYNFFTNKEICSEAEKNIERINL